MVSLCLTACQSCFCLNPRPFQWVTRHRGRFTSLSFTRSSPPHVVRRVGNLFTLFPRYQTMSTVRTRQSSHLCVIRQTGFENEAGQELKVDSVPGHVNSNWGLTSACELPLPPMTGSSSFWTVHRVTFRWHSNSNRRDWSLRNAYPVGAYD